MQSTPPIGASTEPPRLRLPAPQTLFLARAARFRQLAETRPSLAGYLKLMAELADIQHELAAQSPALPWPETHPGRPPPDSARHPREPAWRAAARAIARRLNPDGEPLAALLQRIQRASDSELEAWADALLAADCGRIDAGLAPFLAAALQVQWTAQAARLDAARLQGTEAGFYCPACGSLPVAGLLQTGGPIHGLRYLCCSLCCSEWRRTRIDCIHCGSSKEVGYYALEGEGGAVKAEACGECRTYLKLMNREKDVRVDPFADDLATLSLDILMAEEGYERLGFNPLLIPGA
jgi:FdhE protein